MIRDTLGFGRVIQQGQRTYRYIVQDKKALELLVALFNGNLVLPTKQRNFKKFVDLYNQKAGKGRIILEKVNPIQSEILPSLDNGGLGLDFVEQRGLVLRANVCKAILILFRNHIKKYILKNI